MTPPHTQEFEDAITVTPKSSHTYSTNLNNNWAIGAVPHGGYTMAVLYRLAITHFKHTHPTRHNSDPMPISMQMTFLRRSTVGPAILTVEDAKLGARTSTIHVTLSQEDSRSSQNGELKKNTARVVGYITVSDPVSDVGISSPSDWTLYPPPPSQQPPDVKLTPEGSFALATDNSLWKAVGSKFSKFRRVGNHTAIFGPAHGDKLGIVDQWARLRTVGPQGGRGRWTNEAAVVLIDLFPMALGGLDRQAVYSTADGDATPPFWFPTVSLNIDFKKRLPTEGVDWLYSRVNMKTVRNGRTDIEVIMKDEAGDIVALGSQVGLVVGASRNTSGRNYEKSADAKAKI
ncbi:thioesterase-like superfamily-domain-containing protein [Talaromyces proteolyticus]|uniref:Thioesterase-like superfamily-domain-containing protein n=1 Tax=Talaromyces proteolyticus TaxID=1131652 RepID=A0AAD4Q178_9EURO|nr:thioesterase-like superfamily-domain-containing protein [Talaromyces proteolyticus]KAH8698278.1 thioesterase-like superfamily-domain-containing protein [Talaromyces proteolyticus]